LTRDQFSATEIVQEPDVVPRPPAEWHGVPRAGRCGETTVTTYRRYPTVSAWSGARPRLPAASTSPIARRQ
jgi:hypothetical protein